MNRPMFLVAVLGYFAPLGASDVALAAPSRAAVPDVTAENANSVPLRSDHVVLLDETEKAGAPGFRAFDFAIQVELLLGVRLCNPYTEPQRLFADPRYPYERYHFTTAISRLGALPASEDGAWFGIRLGPLGRSQDYR
jgi:hypothetical protein